MDRSPCSATAEYSVARTTRLDTSSASSDEPSRQDSAVVVGIGPTSLPAVTAEHGGDDSSYTLAAVADDQPPGARAAGTSEHGNTTSRRRLGCSPGRDEHLWLPLGVNAGGHPPRAVHRTAVNPVHDLHGDGHAALRVRINAIPSAGRGPHPFCRTFPRCRPASPRDR